MDTTRKKRLEELRQAFIVTEINGQTPPQAVVADTIATYLNKKYKRQVVVPRDRRGSVF